MEDLEVVERRAFSDCIVVMRCMPVLEPVMCPAGDRVGSLEKDCSLQALVIRNSSVLLLSAGGAQLDLNWSMNFSSLWDCLYREHT